MILCALASCADPSLSGADPAEDATALPTEALDDSGAVFEAALPQVVVLQRKALGRK